MLVKKRKVSDSPCFEGLYYLVFQPSWDVVGGWQRLNHKESFNEEEADAIILDFSLISQPDDEDVYLMANNIIDKHMSKKKPDIIFKHIKTGGKYRFVCFGDIEKGLVQSVIYQSCYDNRIWVRPVEEFGERFVRIY